MTTTTSRKINASEPVSSQIHSGTVGAGVAPGAVHDVPHAPLVHVDGDAHDACVVKVLV